MSVPAAAAQSSAAEKAAAEALFDDGLQLMEAGEYARACKKLESSQRIDPGIGTLLYLGDCYEKVGRTASAWATFREAASMADAAGQERRARVGLQRADALEPKLNHVVVTLAEGAEAAPEMTVTLAGQTLPRGVWGTPVPVDPGEQELVVEAPGYHPYSTVVSVSGEGQEQRVELPPLQPKEQATSAPGDAAGSEETPETSPAGGSTALGDPAVDSSERPGKTQRTLGLISGGLGVVGVGVGTAFGLVAIDRQGQIEDAGDRQEAESLTDEAFGAATVADVAFIAGGVLLASGVVLYLTAPKAAEPGEGTARLGISPRAGGAALTWGGSF